jgi:hypothetical protein
MILGPVCAVDIGVPRETVTRYHALNKRRNIALPVERYGLTPDLFGPDET